MTKMVKGIYLPLKALQLDPFSPFQQSSFEAGVDSIAVSVFVVILVGFDKY